MFTSLLIVIYSIGHVESILMKVNWFNNNIAFFLYYIISLINSREAIKLKWQPTPHTPRFIQRTTLETGGVLFCSPSPRWIPPPPSPPPPNTHTHSSPTPNWIKYNVKIIKHILNYNNRNILNTLHYPLLLKSLTTKSDWGSPPPFLTAMWVLQTVTLRDVRQWCNVLATSGCIGWFDYPLWTTWRLSDTWRKYFAYLRCCRALVWCQPITKKCHFMPLERQLHSLHNLHQLL